MSQSYIFFKITFEFASWRIILLNSYILPCHQSSIFITR